MLPRFKELRVLMEAVDTDFIAYLEAKDCGDLGFCFRWLLVPLCRFCLAIVAENRVQTFEKRIGINHMSTFKEQIQPLI
jgi:hypothetical protein